MCTEDMGECILDWNNRDKRESFFTLSLYKRMREIS